MALSETNQFKQLQAAMHTDIQALEESNEGGSTAWVQLGDIFLECILNAAFHSKRPVCQASLGNCLLLGWAHTHVHNHAIPLERQN
ncbi:hypothetical protein STEG23_004264 [Scotinomys teguina]